MVFKRGRTKIAYIQCHFIYMYIFFTSIGPVELVGHPVDGQASRTLQTGVHHHLMKSKTNTSDWPSRPTHNAFNDNSCNSASSPIGGTVALIKQCFQALVNVTNCDLFVVVKHCGAMAYLCSSCRRAVDGGGSRVLGGLLTSCLVAFHKALLMESVVTSVQYT